jgi:hypothetical protein
MPVEMGWEAREDINAAARGKGLKPPSDHQLERWRGARLLPPVRQDPNAYRGSTVEHPPGTAKQVVRLMELLAVKEKFDYVGWQLWWEGFDVGEEHWRPKLKAAAKSGDKALRGLRGILTRWRNDESDSRETEFDKLQHQIPTASLAPQIARRLSAPEIAALLRVLTHVGAGEFFDFDDVPNPDELSEHEIVVSGLNMEKSGSYAGGTPRESIPKPDQIFGQSMNFIQVLPIIFRDMAKALRKHSLADAFNFPLDELLAARDDVRGALRIGEDLYEGTKWIYGNRAFGLRLAAWLSRAMAPQRALLVLGFALLKRTDHPFWGSDQIAELVLQAEIAKRNSLRLKEIAESDPRFSDVLNPKRIKSAFADEIALKRWQRELNAITVSGATKALIGLQ